MRNNKKMIFAAFMCSCTLMMNMPALAADTAQDIPTVCDEEINVADSDGTITEGDSVTFIQENVSESVMNKEVTEEQTSESITDAKMASDLAETQSAPRKASSKVYWKVEGHRQYKPKSTGIAKPVGSSTHMRGDTVLNTFHYTRTYFGPRRGDSGRVWGTGKVTAVGDWCDREIVNWYRLYVKYGTSD